ncbi:unnamed protein product [Jaminaea pallidilutea]
MHFALVVTLAVLAATAQAQNASWPSILLFTKTAGFRHDSIPAAVEVITRLGNGQLTLSDSNVDSSIKSARWNTVRTEDATKFDDASYLKGFDAIVFAFTTDVDPPAKGSLLTDSQTANFLSYIEQGGNFAGIHSSTNTLYSYPAYGRLAGAFFTYHAQSQQVSLRPTTRDHPSVSKLPDPFSIKEEMYHLRTNPRNLPSPAQVLVTNASAYPDPGGQRGEGKPQPLAWYRSGSLLNSSANALGGDLDGQTQYSGGSGRSWVTTLGHEVATWSNPSYQGHIHGGIGWVLSVSALSTTPSSSSDQGGQETSTGAMSGDATATSSAGMDSDSSSSSGNSSSSAGSLTIPAIISSLSVVAAAAFVLL